jgi:glycosyltransferase involved in cell wall biosynthesis
VNAPEGEALFLVWGPPSHGPRSKVLGRELGIDVHFVQATMRRGLLVAPYKYVRQAVATVALLRKHRPRVVFVQSPPSLAVLVTAGYCAVTGAGYVVDAHSDAMLSSWWTRPRWMYRILARRALTTVVTNEHFAARLRADGARALVLPDVPTTFTSGVAPELGDGFHVLVVNTFASDEPLAEAMEAARRLPDVRFHVTGRSERHPEVTTGAPPNLRFTGFLPDEEYYALMERVDAVMCLTTRDHTMQRGACEALSMGRPIVTSGWPLLRSYFSAGTVHVDATPDAIAAGVEQMREHHRRYELEILGLRETRHQQWQTARRALSELLDAVPITGTGR